MSQHAPPPVPVAVEEIERRIRWPALPALLFLGIMVVLGVVAIVGIRQVPPVLRGLPEDPDVAAARSLARGAVRLAPGELRFRTALLDPPARETPPAGPLGEDPIDIVVEPRSPAAHVRIARAGAHLDRALARAPREPRLGAARAFLHLALADRAPAERLYRGVVDRAPGYGEARVGLGLTLALRADRDDVFRERRRFLLQAIAQFAAVRPEDPVFEAALYDRVVLLAEVRRDREARRLLEEYRARFPGRWAERLAVVVESRR